nr:putative O-antigen flippase [Vibrio cholerae]
MNKSILDLLFLYAGRTMGLLVGFIVLPLYRENLGEFGFSLVVMYLTCSSIAVMLDFGFSTYINRETASSDRGSDTFSKLISCEVIFSLFFLIVMLAAIPISLSMESEVELGAILLAIISILLNVLNNFYSYFWLGNKSYKLAGSIQGGAALLKAISGLIALGYISDTIEAYLISQILSVFIVNTLTRLKIRKYIRNVNVNLSVLIRLGFSTLKKTYPIMMFSLSGAAVLQLDKIIISEFSGIEFVSNYYLAMTLSMLPITVFAAPVSQFFQPKVISNINDRLAFNKVTEQYIVAITLVSALPTIALYLLREPLITMWLGGGEDTEVVIGYVKTLLAGVFVGSLGFVPCSILIAKEKYKLQAKIAVVFTLVTLSFVVYFAFENSVESVCFTYAFYHAFSTIALWIACVFVFSKGKVGSFQIVGLQAFLALIGVLFLV